MKKDILNSITSQVKKMLLGIAVIFTLLALSNITYAQAPTLGSAAGFIAFTTDGAVVNTGQSQFTGNIGTNNGPISGFGNVNGVMHSGDIATAQCAADLLIAYNQLNIATPNFFPSNLLGNGDTLVAGVYKIFSSAVLNLSLYLDAKGNPNALFIFQIQGALSANALSKIKLINGALACNVFWKVEGVVDLSTGTYMRGTVIANNAAINMAANDTLEGRVLSTTGAVSFSGVNTAMPLGCGSLVLTGSPSPILGAVACYGIFSGNGTISNAGVSYVTGDIGTNVGTTTGFDSSKVTGKIHKTPDASTALCATDLQNVYNYLNTITPDIELLYPAQFGNNLELTPHTYLLNASTAFTGNVFLNAQGNANAVFIIKVNGAFATGTFSKVVLKNGAQAKNIFWKIEGAVSIDNFSVFSGSIVCNNGAISLNTGDTLHGRALTTSGTISTTGINAAIATEDCATLPLNWVYFKGKPVGKNVMLEWATANEINNSYFTIEKSKNGSMFTTLAIISAIRQATGAGKHYSFTDELPYSLNYYRIYQTDMDGKKMYFNTIQVKVSKEIDVKVSNAIGDAFIHIQLTDAPAGKLSIELYSINGLKVFSQQNIIPLSPYNLAINKPAHSGVYLIYMECNGQKLYSGKVMVF